MFYALISYGAIILLVAITLPLYLLIRTRKQSMEREFTAVILQIVALILIAYLLYDIFARNLDNIAFMLIPLIAALSAIAAFIFGYRHTEPPD